MAEIKNAERDEPVYWFVLLEIAIDRNDFESAATAKRELQRLGVTVTYDRKSHIREKRKAVTR